MVNDGLTRWLQQWILFFAGIGMIVVGVKLTIDGEAPDQWYWAAALAATGIGNEIAKRIGGNGKS